MPRTIGRKQGGRAETIDPRNELRRLSLADSAELLNVLEMFALLGEAVPQALAITPALDLAAAESRAGRDIARQARGIVRRILRDAAGIDGGKSKVVGTIGMDESDAPQPGLAGDPTLAFVGLAGLVAEVGYDEHTASVFPVPMPDGRFALSWTALSREAADVALIERVMDRLELWASRDQIGAMEREASRHWFERFSPRPRADEMSFARDVREQEFTFAGRPFVSLGDTVAHTYEVARGRTLPPGPRRMLRALVRSRPSIFIVRRREGRSVTMEDVAEGREYAVTEHNDSIIYGPGWAVLGRLLPVEDGRYLRSPGTMIAKWTDVEAHAGDILDGARRAAIPPELLLEAIYAATEGQKVPRKVRPAQSRKLANEMLFDFSVALRDAGLAREIPMDDAPSSLRELATPERVVLQMQMDEVLAEWFRALSEQAGIAGPGTVPIGRAKGRRRKKKRGR
jgi:hypothetical protein